MGMFGNIVGGLITTGINAAIASAQQSENNDFIAAENEKNRQFAAEQADRDRAQNYQYGEMSARAADARSRGLYNDLQSPEAMLEQYKRAGLSPSLMFGGSGAGGQSVPNGAQGTGANGISTPFTYSNISPVEASQMALAEAQARNLDAHTDEILGLTTKSISEITEILARAGHHEAAAKLTEAEESGQRLQNYITSSTAEFNITKAAEEAEIYATNAQKAVYELISVQNKAEFDEKTLEARINSVKADVRLKNAQELLTKANTKLNKTEVERINAEIDKWQVELEQGYTDLAIKLYNAQNQEEYNKILNDYYDAQEEALKTRVGLEQKELRHTIINDHIGNVLKAFEIAMSIAKQ